ncbi:mannose-1-phosphate guanylyltransferase [Rhizobiales bacterium TNE-4]|nr:mannose-1-phosphate guanylyltransferase [Rhizobiales bacterium TNE-4]MBV1827550.1 NTP transferase domain-containing protein [Rhizobiales bacterium TNE-4]
MIVDLTDVHAVLLLGGGGTRLWPLSTDAHPKQFLKIFGGKSLFQLTLERIKACQIKSIYVVTNQKYFDIAVMQAHILEVKLQFILEPIRRDSAPAIAAAVAAIASQTGSESIVAVFPCDHLIADTSLFCEAVKDAIGVSRSGALVTFGIYPTAPSSEYGYIQKGLRLDSAREIYRAVSFKEKPIQEDALTYIASGDYYWNSGIFIFRVSKFENEASIHMPQIWNAVRHAIEDGELTENVLLLSKEAFGAAEKVSIDYALFEKSHSVVLLTRNFPWSDVGNWASIYDALPHDVDGNARGGDAEIYESRNTLVYADGIRVIALGVHDLIIVASADGVFVAPKGRAADVKKLF